MIPSLNKPYLSHTFSTNPTSLVSAAAAHFVNRDYQGLLPQVPEGHDTNIQPGQFGIAAGYVTLPPMVTISSPHSEP